MHEICMATKEMVDSSHTAKSHLNKQETNVVIR